MPEPDISVYWASGSPPAWRVLLALKEKGLAFKSNLLNMTNKEHKSADVLAINPRGQVRRSVIIIVSIRPKRVTILYYHD